MIFHRYCVALVCTYQKFPIFFQEAETLLIIPSDSLKRELNKLEVSWKTYEKYSSFEEYPVLTTQV